MKLYLDDDLIYRKTPPGWARATTYDEAVEIVLAAREDGIEITEMSLDHDLADIHYYWQSNVKQYLGENTLDKMYKTGEMTGYHFIEWVSANDAWPTEAIHIHTMNPVGSEKMIRVITYDGSYTRREGRSFYAD